MKFVFTFLSIVFFSISTCQAGLGDDLEKEFYQNLDSLLKITLKITKLKEENYAEYFGEEGLHQSKINTYNTIIKESFSAYKTVGSNIRWFDINKNNNVSNLFFIPYCRNIHLIKAISESQSNAHPTSRIYEDLGNILHFFDFFPKYFSDLEKTFAAHLKIEKKSTIKGIAHYSVQLDQTAIFIDHKREARNIANIINAIDVNKLSLPVHSHHYLKVKLDAAQRALKGILNQSVRSFQEDVMVSKNKNPLTKMTYREISSKDFSKFEGVFEPLPKTLENRALLDLIKDLAFDPIEYISQVRPSDHPIFVENKLTPEEREKYKPLVQTMIEEGLLKGAKGQPAAQPKQQPGKKGEKGGKKTQLVEKRVDSRRKRKSKKKGTLTSQAQPQQPAPVSHDSSLNKPGTTKTQPDFPIENESAPVPVKLLKGDESLNDNLVNLSITLNTDAIPFLEEKEEDRSGIEKEKEKEKEAEAPVANEEIEEDPVASTRTWLQEILHNAHNHFMVQNKAQSLLRELDQNNPYLLVQIQEATSGLALQLQQSQTASQDNKSLIVPQKMESAFRYFRDTPMSYLQGTRMGFVTTLLEGLGIQIDKSREGSRVHMSYQKQHLSVHIHDKNNGALDGGRLNSLRKFLLDIGFVLEDEISN